jgi:hypothetical protein
MKVTHSGGMAGNLRENPARLVEELSSITGASYAIRHANAAFLTGFVDQGLNG